MAKWTAERWSEVSPYLDRALELGADERRDWLAELAISRAAIALDVRGLLAQHEINGAAQFLEHSPLAAADEPHAGEQVGAYTLKHPLGRGGMGTVWLAERSDGRFEGKVAIKILSHCGFGPDAAAQIRREASSLARLSHPNIARLFDAGIRDDGRPFLILEYIQGERIDRYCSRNQTTLADRLRLLLPVLEAVAHAHEHGIIHRDLKPSNILVTPEKIPKLLDFGVASLQPVTHRDLQSPGIAQEPAGMTPDYASPEQIRGEASTPASDVYTLGILAHATLTSDCKRRRVRGDLDSIIAKAANREAAARYANAKQFAEDIRRFLDGRPVQARRPTLGYRAALYLRRLAGWQPGSPVTHRRARSGALLAGALLLPLAGVILWISSWNNRIPQTLFPPSETIDQRSIAVLPFRDLSEEKHEEYFSDGLSEELLDRLAHLTNLRVVARTSSFQFKGTREDVRSIAHQLGVAHLLEGSVRKSGNLLRISVQLIRATDGSQMWSQTYDRSLGDVFFVQADIADRVAGALNVTLRNDASRDEPPTVNVDAYNLVLQGNFLKARTTRIDVERAMSLYNQAIGLDPDYALPWALLGDAYFMEASSGWIPREDGVARARAALERSIHMNSKLIWPHYTLANIYANFDFDWTAAYAEIQRMRQIDASDTPPVLGASADMEADFGRLERAIELYKAALKSDPLNTIDLASLAYAQFAAGRRDESIATIRRLLELAPQFTGARAQLAIYLLHSGKYADALAAVRQESDEGTRMFALPLVYWASGHRNASDATLSELEQRHAADDAYGIACVRAYRGEIDLAMQWLERAYRQRDSGLSLVKIDPLLRSLHGDRRYQALLRKLKLTREAG